MARWNDRTEKSCPNIGLCFFLGSLLLSVVGFAGNVKAEDANTAQVRQDITRLLGVTSKGNDQEIPIADLRQVSEGWLARVGQISETHYFQASGQPVTGVLLQNFSFSFPQPGGANGQIKFDKGLVLVAGAPLSLPVAELPNWVRTSLDQGDIVDGVLKLDAGANLLGTVSITDPANQTLKAATAQLGLVSNQVRVSGRLSLGVARTFFSGNMLAAHDSRDFADTHLRATFPDGSPLIAQGHVSVKTPTFVLTTEGQGSSINVVARFEAEIDVSAEGLQYACDCVVTLNPPTPDPNDPAVALSRGLLGGKEIVNLKGTIKGPMPDLSQMPVVKLPGLQLRLASAAVIGGWQDNGDFHVGITGKVAVGGKQADYLGVMVASDKQVDAGQDRVRMLARLNGDLSMPDLIGDDFGVPALRNIKLEDVTLTRHVVTTDFQTQGEDSQAVLWQTNDANGKQVFDLAMAHKQAKIDSYFPAVKGTPASDLSLENAILILAPNDVTITGVSALNQPVGLGQFPPEVSALLGSSPQYAFPRPLKGGLNFLGTISVSGSDMLKSVWSDLFDASQDNVLLWGSVAKEILAGAESGKSAEELMEDVDLWAQLPTIKSTLLPPRTTATPAKLHLFGKDKVVHAQLETEVKVDLDKVPLDMLGTVDLSGGRDKDADLVLTALQKEPWKNPFGIDLLEFDNVRLEARLNDKVVGGGASATDPKAQLGVGETLLGAAPRLVLHATTKLAGKVDVATLISVWIGAQGNALDLNQVGFRMEGDYKLADLPFTDRIPQNNLSNTVLQLSAKDPELVIEVQKKLLSLRTKVIVPKLNGKTIDVTAFQIPSQAWNLMLSFGGVDVTSGILPSLKGGLDLASGLTGVPLPEPLQAIIGAMPDIDFNGMAFIASVEEADLPLPDLPAPAQDILLSLYGQMPRGVIPHAKLTQGLNFLSSLDAKKLMAKAPLNKLSLNSDLVLQGSIGGLMGNDIPHIALAAVLPEWDFPTSLTNITKKAFVKVEGTQPSFFIKIIPGAAEVGVGLDFIMNVEGSPLRLGGAYEVMVTDDDLGVYLNGAMKGTWLHPFKITPLAITDPIVKCGIEGGEGVGGKCGFSGATTLVGHTVELGANVKVDYEGEWVQVDALAMKGSLSKLSIQDMAELANAAIAIEQGTYQLGVTYNTPIVIGDIENAEIRDVEFAFVTPGAADPDLGFNGEGFVAKGDLFAFNQDLGKVNCWVNATGAKVYGKVKGFSYDGITFDGVGVDVALNTSEPPRFGFNYGVHLMGDDAETVLNFEIDTKKLDGTAKAKIVNTFDADVEVWHQIDAKNMAVADEQRWSVNGGGTFSVAAGDYVLVANDDATVSVVAAPTQDAKPNEKLKWVFVDGYMTSVPTGLVLVPATVNQQTVLLVEQRKDGAKEQMWTWNLDGSFTNQSSGQVLALGDQDAQGNRSVKLAALSQHDTQVHEFDLKAEMQENFKHQVETGVNKFMGMSLEDHKRNLEAAAKEAGDIAKKMGDVAIRYAKEATDAKTLNAVYQNQRQAVARHIQNAQKAEGMAKADIAKAQTDIRTNGSTVMTRVGQLLKDMPPKLEQVVKSQLQQETNTALQTINGKVNALNLDVENATTQQIDQWIGEANEMLNRANAVHQQLQTNFNNASNAYNAVKAEYDDLNGRINELKKQFNLTEVQPAGQGLRHFAGTGRFPMLRWQALDMPIVKVGVFEKAVHDAVDKARSATSGGGAAVPGLPSTPPTPGGSNNPSFKLPTDEVFGNNPLTNVPDPAAGARALLAQLQTALGRLPDLETLKKTKDDAEAALNSANNIIKNAPAIISKLSFLRDAQAVIATLKSDPVQVLSVQLANANPDPLVVADTHAVQALVDLKILGSDKAGKVTVPVDLDLANPGTLVNTVINGVRGQKIYQDWVIANVK